MYWDRTGVFREFLCYNSFGENDNQRLVKTGQDWTHHFLRLRTSSLDLRPQLEADMINLWDNSSDWTLMIY